MQHQPDKYRPWIWRRSFVLVLIAAWLPLLIAGGYLLQLTHASPARAPHHQAVVSHLGLMEERISSQARNIELRITQLSRYSSMISSYAEDILATPQVFAQQAGYSETPIQPETDDNAADGTETDPEDEALPADSGTHLGPLDNPYIYVKKDDGSIKKIIDDGGSALYFARRAGGQFTDLDWQRVFASSVLDPLLREPVEKDQLCSRSFLITRDGMLRTYPHIDLSMWPADVDFTKPYDFWQQEKADEHGIVWTSPYVSIFNNRWVVACMASVPGYQEQMAVAGIEIELANLPADTVGFRVGDQSINWLMQAQGVTGSDQRWTVIAGSGGTTEELGIEPLSSQPAPESPENASDMLEDADLLSGLENTTIVKAVTAQLNATGRLAETPSIITLPDKQLIFAHSVAGTNWSLCSVATSSTVDHLEETDTYIADLSHSMVYWIIAAALAGLFLAFVAAVVMARQIAHPLRIMTENTFKAAESRSVVSVQIDDPGEIGKLSRAIQYLIDVSYHD